MLWLITTKDNPDTATLRAEHMAPHRAYQGSRKDIIVLAGATQSDDGETSTGSCFVVNVDNREEARAFSDGDPFTEAGIFAEVNITRMRKGQWNPEVAENA